MSRDPCVSPDQLENLVRCRLSEVEAQRIESHLEVCPACHALVVQLEESASQLLAKNAPEPTALAFEQEPELQRLIASLEGQATKLDDPAFSDDRMADPPTTLGNYVILEKIGEGGMGTVYRARHTHLKNVVALKVLKPSLSLDPHAISRFRREMSLVGRLQHPHLVRAYDAGQDAGILFLVLEFVEGKDLSEILRNRGPLPISTACELARQTACGLQYACEMGLIHRDIKPSNLMLASPVDGTAEATPVLKILDLGLARSLEPQGQSEHGPITSTGQVVGTIDYMAPEQASDSREIDIRVDLYSLGAVLFELLTGQPPFQKYSHLAPTQRMMAMAQNSPPPLTQLRSDVPGRLARIVARLLAKRSADRFATPAEVITALEPFCRGANLQSLLADAANSGSATIRINTTVDPPLTRRRNIFLMLLMLSLALAGTIALSARRGTVVVSFPSGQTNPELIVALSRHGRELVTLKAGNNWTAGIAPGSVDLKLIGDQSQLELTEPTQRVNWFGTTVISLRLRNLPAPGVIAAAPGLSSASEQSLKPSLSDPLVRDTAVRLLNAGCNLWLRQDGTNNEQYVSSPAALPTDDTLRVTGVVVEGGRLIPEFWQLVRKFSRLRSLIIECPVDAEAYEQAGALTQLEILSLSSATDQRISKLINLGKLTELSLPGGNLTDASANVLRQMGRLEVVDLSASPVTAKILDVLPPIVRALRINDTQIQGTDLQVLQRFPNLGELAVSGDQLDAAGFLAISQLGIRTLSVNGSRPAEWSAIQLPQSLRGLSIAADNAYIPDLHRLRACPQLKSLQLLNCHGDHSLWTDLGACSSLEAIELYSTRIDSAELEMLRQKLPNCNISVR